MPLCRLISYPEPRPLIARNTQRELHRKGGGRNALSIIAEHFMQRRAGQPALQLGIQLRRTKRMQLRHLATRSPLMRGKLPDRIGNGLAIVHDLFFILLDPVPSQEGIEMLFQEQLDHAADDAERNHAHRPNADKPAQPFRAFSHQ